ncbi:thiamine phosphate synthase [Chryseobacterium sp. PTM-20240506]|uniref:thiamine phosphate synthase n=1 Tax=unclassified Chryseobacterium TaxID=2593645 RepID=UPI0023580D0D|nr:MULTISPECIES: thiamine phosphate synthase [unclassified Chryseobacterium]MDC8105762.1 thiamine phosphate synthase [Chryseobacterium sp. B21-037]MDQ1804265.1 thiamine phosphate synthase [Chryseobacterium sp. CKR4-1]
MVKEKLQYISQGNTKEEQELNIYRALDAGVKWVQVRWKNAPGKELFELCEKSKLQCTEYGAICIINDHIHLAELVDADGVHLGLDDDTITQARQILGPEKIVGGTANTLEDVLQRIDESCDYIGLGPLRYTPTKEKLSPVLGFKGYQQLIRDLEKRSVKIPAIYAIGGVRLEDVELLQEIGIHGVAVSGQITGRPSVVNEFIKSFK